MAPSTARDLEVRGGGHPAPHLLRGEPSEVYSRITAGDPLRMEERSALRLLELAYLMDADRVVERAQLWVARKAHRYEGGLGDWLVAQIDRAVADLLVVDRKEVEDGLRSLDESDSRYSFMTDQFAVLPEETLIAAVRFNDLPEPYRRALFALVIRNRPLEECIADGTLGTKEEMAFRTCYALEMIMFGDVEVALKHPIAEKELGQ